MSAKGTSKFSGDWPTAPNGYEWTDGLGYVPRKPKTDAEPSKRISIKLNPCPFCKGRLKREQISYIYPRYRATCTLCGVQVEAGSKKDLAEKVNRRGE